jgi:ubiquinone/menaquinone biosynthesis C-methylase UbiE
MTDYDLTDIPAAYDRARDHGPEFLDLWMQTVAEHVKGRSMARILDLGCGTGRFSEALAARFEADVIGIDPSRKMLQVAREKRRDSRVRYAAGRAEAIPLSADSVDLVFISMSLHHFADPPAAAKECRRVLSRGGLIMIRTGTREQIPSYPYVPFFAGSRPLLEAMLPTKADIFAAFGAAHFHVVASQLITQTIASDWMVYAEKARGWGRLSPRPIDSAGFSRWACSGEALRGRRRPRTRR